MIAVAAPNILIVEDEIVIARELEDRLNSLGYAIAGIAASEAEALTIVEQTRPQLVLMDIALKGSGDGVEAAAEIRRRWGLPVIYLTAYADPSTLQRAKLTEPFGYIVKPFSERELHANIEMALYKHQVDTKLRQIETWFSASMQRISEGVIFITRDDGVICYMNRVAEMLTGLPCGKAVGRKANDLFHLVSRGSRESLEDPVARTLREGIVTETRRDVLLVSEQNEEIPVDYTGACLRDEAQNPTGVVLVFRDLSEHRRTEELIRQADARVLQAQKLESLGVLAGGIAHDFNNLLTTMLGHASLALMQLPAESVACPMLREIEKAAQRAAELTQQMLAYAGKGRFVVQSLRLDTLVQEMTKLLQTVVSKKAAVELDLGPATIRGDAAQIRQVVMNLMTNASDALEGNIGTIRVRTGTRPMSVTDLRSPFLQEELPAGAYAFLEVEDNGCGMSAETVARIFDPFFTTKFTGRGLGLAAVLGIVRSQRGAIKVTSTPGRGSLFEVLFPSATSETVAEGPPALPRGQGTVLVVDDEPGVRDLARRVLESAGFQVLTAVDGQEALEVFARHSPQLAAVLLDMTMPRMDGSEVLRQLRNLAAHVPVLVMSGYSEPDVSARLAGLGAKGVVQKPFLPQDLIEHLCRVLPSKGSKENP